MLLPLTTFAQLKPEFGVKTGLNYSNSKLVTQASGISDDNMYRVAYHMGIFTRFNLHDKYSFIPELYISSKGYRLEESTVRLTYLSLPVLLAYNPIERLKVLLGPEISFRLSSILKDDSGTIKANEFWDNKIDISGSIGLAYVILESLEMHLRYSHGFSSVIDDLNITDENATPIDEKVKLKNRTFQLGVSYTIW